MGRRHPEVHWRAKLVYRKLSGELPRDGWATLGFRILPWSTEVRNAISPSPKNWVKSPSPKNWVKSLSAVERDQDWSVQNLFFGATPCMDSFDAHFSTLREGILPHALHQHRAEEIIVPIAGDVDVIRAKDGAGTDQVTRRTGPGSLIYHSAHRFHAIRAVGPGPSKYVVFKWESSADRTINEDRILRSTIIEYADTGGEVEGDRAWTLQLLFESPTRHLYKLHGHLSRMQPGAGYPPDTDPYDIGIVVLGGNVETVGSRVSAPGVIFYSAHKPHALRNPGDTLATYLVIEFHGCESSD